MIVREIECISLKKLSLCFCEGLINRVAKSRTHIGAAKEERRGGAHATTSMPRTCRTTLVAWMDCAKVRKWAVHVCVCVCRGENEFSLSRAKISNCRSTYIYILGRDFVSYFSCNLGLGIRWFLLPLLCRIQPGKTRALVRIVCTIRHTRKCSRVYIYINICSDVYTWLENLSMTSEKAAHTICKSANLTYNICIREYSQRALL